MSFVVFTGQWDIDSLANYSAINNESSSDGVSKIKAFKLIMQDPDDEIIHHSSSMKVGRLGWDNSREFLYVIGWVQCFCFFCQFLHFNHSILINNIKYLDHHQHHLIIIIIIITIIITILNIIIPIITTPSSSQSSSCQHH